MKSFSSNATNQSYNIELKDGKYTINGVIYNDFNDIPAELKETYQLEDIDGNGVSDNFDSLQEMAKNFHQGFSHQTKISLNGKDYNSWDEVPSDLRAQHEQMQKMFDKVMPNSSGILSKNFRQTQNKISSQTPTYANTASQAPISSNLGAKTEGNGLRWTIIIIASLIFLYLMFGDQIKSSLF